MRQTTDHRSASDGSEPTVAVVTNVPNHYRIPLFNELRRQLEDEGYALHVIFAAPGYPFRRQGASMEDCRFSYDVLGKGPVLGGESRRVVFGYGGLGKVLRRIRPAAVVVSGFSPAALRLWLRSYRHREPYLIWSGAVAGSGREHSPLRGALRRLLISRAAGFVAYGSAARDYLLSLGAGRQDVTVAVNTVDTAALAAAVRGLREAAGPAAEKKLLYVGNLEAGKRVDLLLPLMAAVAGRHRGVVLEIVGDGSRRRELEETAKRLGLGRAVRFAGSVPHAEIPGCLAGAFAFLFPSSYDIWGLAVVEAMAAGLPVFSSVHGGATRDLVRDGETGFAVDFTDTPAAAAKISALLEQPAEARRIGEAAARFIASDITLQRSAAGFVKALRPHLGKAP